MNRQFRRREREDQPSVASIHGCSSEDLTEKGAISRRILAVYNYMGTKDHERAPFSLPTPFEPRNVTRQFKALLTAAKLRDIRLHDLRHSCATLFLVQGVNPRVVMETLGHSQVSLTLTTYSHVLPALQRDAASRIDALLAES